MYNPIYLLQQFLTVMKRVQWRKVAAYKLTVSIVVLIVSGFVKNGWVAVGASVAIAVLMVFLVIDAFIDDHREKKKARKLVAKYPPDLHGNRPVNLDVRIDNQSNLRKS